MIKFPATVLLAIGTLVAVAPVMAGAPNILIITCDNLGYGDLAMYHPESRIRTPNLDRLARQGARLTNFYTASPTCTVSRACLLTGRIPQRHGLVDQLAGVAGNYGVGLAQHEMLIPRILKGAPTPYATACFGKWNIGFAAGSRPTERGFDRFLGHVSGNMDYFRHNYRDRHDLFVGTKPLYREGEYATDIFADAASEFIEEHADGAQPWFIYLPFNAPHFPVQANKRPGEANIYQAPEWAFHECGVRPDEADPRKRYEVTVYALDKAIGRVLDQLQRTQQAENTFIFFFSDNGAFRLNRAGLDVGVNDPLQSGGVTCWEGGIRVPALAVWPGNIPAGSAVDEPLWSLDLLQACALLAKAPLPKGVIYDGKDPLPTLCGKGDSPHRQMFFQYREHAALREGDWKIVREGGQAPWLLFYLRDDLGEARDLAERYPQRVERMVNAFNEWKLAAREDRAVEYAE